MPDTNWLTATDQDAPISVRVGFPDPVTNPSGLQVFRAFVRKSLSGESFQPALSMSLYEDGSLVEHLITNHLVSSGSGEIVSGVWDASSLSNATGDDVELLIQGGTAPFFVSAGDGASTTGTSVSVPYPAGILENDFLILQILTTDTSNDNTTANLPTDWTFRYGVLVSGSTYKGEGSNVDSKQIIFTRAVPSGGLAGSLSVTVATPQTNEAVFARMYAFRGVDLTTPIENAALQEGTDDSIEAPTITASGFGRLAVCLIGVGAAVTLIPSFTGESGGNWAYPVDPYISTTGNDGAIELQLAPIVDSISGGSTTISASNAWIARGFALRPAQINSVDIGAVKWMSDVEGASLTPVDVTLGSFIESLRNTEVTGAGYYSALAFKSVDRNSFIEALLNKELDSIGFQESLAIKEKANISFLESKKSNELTLDTYQEYLKNIKESNNSFIEYLTLLDITYDDFIESKKTHENSFISFLEFKKTFKITQTGAIENTGLVLSPVSATLISYLEYLQQKELESTGYIESSQSKEISRTGYAEYIQNKNLYSNSYIEYKTNQVLVTISFIEYIKNLVHEDDSYLELKEGHSVDSVNYLENISNRNLSSISYLENIKINNISQSGYLTSLEHVISDYISFIEYLRTNNITQVSFYDNLGLILTEITPVLAGFLEYTSHQVQEQSGYLSFINTVTSVLDGYVINNIGRTLTINSYIEFLQTNNPVSTSFRENLNTRLMPNESFFSCEGVVLKVAGSFIENLKLTATERTTAYSVLESITSDFDSYYSFVDRFRIQESGYLANSQTLKEAKDSYIAYTFKVITGLTSDYRTLESIIPVLISYGEVLRTLGIPEQAYLEYDGYVARLAEFVRIIGIELKASKLEDIRISKSGMDSIKVHLSKLDDIRLIK